MKKCAGEKSFGAGQVHQPFILLMRRSVTIRMSSVVPIVTRRYDCRCGVLKKLLNRRGVIFRCLNEEEVCAALEDGNARVR